MPTRKETDSITLDLDDLERDNAPGPFKVKLAGETYLLGDPRDLPWDELVNLSFDPLSILSRMVDTAHRDAFGEALRSTPAWKVNELAARYRKHVGLLPAPEANASPTS